MISAKLVLLDLGNTLFYDLPAAWRRKYRQAEAALWKMLRLGGVHVTAAELYGERQSLLGYYYALRGQGVEEPGTFRVLRDLITRAQPGVPDQVIERALRAMYAVTQTNWRAERDAVPMLRLLHSRGFRLGAVSNGSDHHNALELLDKARMLPYFGNVISSAAHGRRKPHPSIFRAALNHFNAGAGDTVMIGDSYEADIAGAHALGMATIWVTRRIAAPTGVLPVQPDARVRRLREIPGLLAWRA